MAWRRGGRKSAEGRAGESGPTATEAKDTTQIRGDEAPAGGAPDGSPATTRADVPRDASAIGARDVRHDDAGERQVPPAPEQTSRDASAVDTHHAGDETAAPPVEHRDAGTTDRPVEQREPATTDRPLEHRDAATTTDRPAEQRREPATADRPVEGPPGAAVPASGAAVAAERSRTEMLRVPGFAPIAPFAGWLAAWGAAALAAYCLLQAGLSLGFGLGIAEGGPGSDGFSAGLWLLIVHAGAFLFGGYVAARMARNLGTTHAVLAWLLAMLATGADALVLERRDGGESVLEQLFIPFWSQNGFDTDLATFVALGAFALAGLVGAILGGVLGSGANRAATREVPVDSGGKPLGTREANDSRETAGA